MGIMDFFRKGKETPASTPQQKPGEQKQQPRPGTAQPGSPQPQGANAPKPQAPAQRDYVIQSGDSLSKIAQRFYGNANDWQKIYQANKDKIKDPNLIHPGQKIIIP
jgi:nucleoid-associated protein YgaU